MTAVPAESTNAAGVRFVDLSVPIQEPVDGELVGALAKNLAAQIQYRDHEELAPRAVEAFGCAIEDLPDGKAWASEVLTLGTHAGTHLDAPWHYFPTSEGKPAKTIDEVPLSACFGDGVVLDLTACGPGERVGRAAVQAAVEATGQPLSAGEIVLLRFDGDLAFGTGSYWTEYPGLTAEATIWLCDQGIKTMGTDAVGFDRDFDSSKREFEQTHDASLLWEAHRVGIDHEYFHMEKLANLRLLPSRGFKVSCFPVRIRAASAGWVRAVAISVSDVPGLATLLDEAVARADLPFAVAMVGDRDGVLWQAAAGEASLSQAAGPHTMVRLYSLSKAVGALMAMIVIDRGVLTLDTPVVSVLPEFSQITVLEEIGPDGPVFRAPRRPVTLRHLLSHTSGLAYDMFDAKQSAYQAVTGSERFGSGRKSSWFQPLMFDPGDAFTYGIGAEWAGLMVAVADGRSIQRFCQEEIFEPLGMVDTAFEPDGRLDRLAQLKIRAGDDAFADHGLAPPPHPEVYGMGSALYGTTSDYLRLQRLVLGRGELEAVRLIGPKTADLLFVNQIGDVSIPLITSQVPAISEDMDWFPDVRKTWTAGFMRVEEDIPGRRRAGSLSWAGLLNTHYWIDPASGIAAVLVTQLLPFCDRRCLAVLDAFERAVYREIVG